MCQLIFVPSLSLPLFFFLVSLETTHSSQPTHFVLSYNTHIHTQKASTDINIKRPISVGSPITKMMCNWSLPLVMHKSLSKIHTYWVELWLHLATLQFRNSLLFIQSSSDHIYDRIILLFYYFLFVMWKINLAN